MIYHIAYLSFYHKKDPLNNPLLSVLGQPELLGQGDKVLDVGCGCGVWGIAAGLTGLPSRILCTDNDPLSTWLTYHSGAEVYPFQHVASAAIKASQV